LGIPHEAQFQGLGIRDFRSGVLTVDRLHEEFERRIKTQTVLPSAETVAMLF
jgi:hypothetical protein